MSHTDKAIAVSDQQVTGQIQTRKALKIEQITPVLRKDSKRIKITFGPYLLKGAGVRPNTIIQESSSPS
jgi:hypothetical protein